MSLLRRFVPVLLLVAGCVDIPSEDRGQVTQAVFDPTVADIPTPNDLAMKDGQIAIDWDERLSDAENTIKSQLNGHDGFSNGSSARVRFTAQVSASSFSDDTVYAIDLGLDGKETPTRVNLDREYAECDSSLSLVSPTGLVPGHKYLFAVRGGENGVKDVNGKPIASMPAFHLLRAGKDLREHLDAIPGKSLEEKKAAAEKLEAIRQSYEPFFQILEEQGLPRREVAVLWSFTTTKHGEVYFDPGSKRIPFPNDLLRDPVTGLVNVPIAADEKPEAVALKKGLSTLDGFSTTAAFALDSSTAIDRSTVVAGKTVRVFAKLPDGTAVEKKDIATSVSDDGKKLVIQPLTPLLPATSYSVIVAGVKDVKATPLFEMPLQQLLAVDKPLIDEAGKSTISSLCIDTVKKVEPLRQNLQPALQSIGADRENVSAAFTFTTLDVVKHVQALWRVPYDENLPLTVENVESGNPFERGYGITMPDIAKIITGKMTTMEFLDPTTRSFRDNGAGVQKKIDFVLTIPTGLSQGAKVPTVIFGHGLFTERRLGMMVANRLASLGMATIMIDFPYHGERSACTADNQCNIGGTCRADGTCDNGFLRVPSFFLGAGMGPGTPSATGGAFIDVANLPASRDHFRQAFVDLSAETRLVREMDWKPVTGGFALDGEKLSWVGISLGGIMGANMSGIDPYYKSMLLNVGGAGIVELMKDSATLGTVLKLGLSQKGINEGTPEWDQFMNAAKWLLDDVDPINISPYARARPATYVDPKTGQTLQQAPKRLRLQMANGDAVVPNNSTLRLKAATGVSDADFRAFTTSPGEGHGFLANPTDIGYLPGQQDMADFLGGN